MNTKYLWKSLSKANLLDQQMERIELYYKQIDGTMKFPNSLEGDLLKVTYMLYVNKK